MDRRRLVGIVSAAGALLLSGVEVAAAAGEVGPPGNRSAQRDDRHMARRLPELPDPPAALGPSLNEETMHLHHDKHHASHVNGLDDAEEKLGTAGG